MFHSNPLYFRIPGCQFFQLFVRRLDGRAFLQKVGKVLVDVHFICSRHFYHWIDQGACLCSGGYDRKQPVLASDDHLLDVTLGRKEPVDIGGSLNCRNWMFRSDSPKASVPIKQNMHMSLKSSASMNVDFLF